MEIDYILSSDSTTIIFFTLALGLISWFMGWGVSFITSLFIKITKS